MTIEQKGLQNTLNSAKEALNEINGELYPKLYKSKESEIKALEIAIDKENWAKKVEKKFKNSLQGEQTPKNKGEKTPTNEDRGTPKLSDLNLKDIRALNDVHDDDVDAIMDLAKFKGIPVAEAKKDPYIQNYLKVRGEERKTAEGSNTGTGKKGSSKVSGKDLLKKAESNFELPDSDEGMKALIEAELQVPKK